MPKRLPPGVINQRTATGKSWFGTWNNPQGDWKECLASLNATYCVGQLESGEKGTPHIQFYAFFDEEKKSRDFKGLPFWCKAISQKDVKRVIEYCTKESTRLEGPFNYGKPPLSDKLGKSRDYSTALKLAKEGRWSDVEADVLIPYLGNLQKLSAYFTTPIEMENTRGEWFYGPPGSGKSFTARKEFPGAYIKDQNKWWDNYAGEEYVILDDLDKQGSCLGHHLKIWLDRYSIRGEIKHGSVALCYKRFIITSNYLPEDLWSEDPVLCQAIRRRCTFREFKGIEDRNDVDRFINMEAYFSDLRTES